MCKEWWIARSEDTQFNVKTLKNDAGKKYEKLRSLKKVGKCRSIIFRHFSNFPDFLNV
jgi:hypothetical protein